MWEQDWRDFTSDAAYRTVNLKTEDEPLPPANAVLGPKARLGDHVIGVVLSPAIEKGGHAAYFYDLDTGGDLGWPAGIPKDEAHINQQQLAIWAAASGADLMCVTYRDPNGTETFVLKSLGMKVWEISSRDLRNIEKLVSAGNLPKGRDAGDLLMHFDAAKKPSGSGCQRRFHLRHARRLHGADRDHGPRHASGIRRRDAGPGGRRGIPHRRAVQLEGNRALTGAAPDATGSSALEKCQCLRDDHEGGSNGFLHFAASRNPVARSFRETGQDAVRH